MLDLNQNLTFRVTRLAQEFSNQSTYVLKKHSDFSLSEWRLMVLAVRAGVTSPAEVIEQTRFDRALVSRTLKSLQQRDMLSLTPDPNDGRKQIIGVTKAGRKAFLSVEKVMQKRQEFIKSQLEPQELAQLMDVLERLHEVAKRRDIDE